ncbi:MAG: biosynthetic-type acetolactate synthase large subunit [Magnetococcales bacterium]|nr:biosynthetic-type acetolactate synthase large subunit [Magnetococcales bacterium]MBF0150048.1 biosynthetic-type acetolactate synthase large subunit [Magnetococcales bacterium]MBF0173499.1 biosynthetic-type acetolactate synthase large subunit [Magnetococcales bacterium]
MELTGAQIVVRTLLDLKVRHVFGYPGGSVLHIYDAMFKHPELNHILCRHEQGAVHAADGYARVSGEVGVALVTSGPGATNAVTGLATANMDSIPLVCISGQVPVDLIGNDAFQEADTVGITRSCTKHNFLVRRVTDLARVLREAFHIARTGRPGPVVVDLPKDVTAALCDYEDCGSEVRIRSYNPTVIGNARQVKKAVSMILEAQRPMIYTGGGVILSNAAAELTRMTRLIGAPITNTLMGLGGFPASDPLFVGMLGMHGTYEANMAVSNCDLLLAIGARFDDRVTGKISQFAPNAKIIHVDIDPTSISKNVKVHLPIVGDVKNVLGQMIALLEVPGARDQQPDLKPWWRQIDVWREKLCLRYHQGKDLIEPQFVIEKLRDLTRANAIVSTDVGQHQMWAAQFYPFDRPRRWLTSGGLGTMGYGLPAAMGASVALPGETVILITGDGSFQMNSQELATCCQFRLPVKIAILNNSYLGMVRQWQQIFYEGRYSQSHMATGAPDFVKLAEAYGAVGLRATRPDEVEPTIRQALATDQTVVMDFRVAEESNVYPMVPAGKALNEMILL